MQTPPGNRGVRSVPYARYRPTPLRTTTAMSAPRGRFPPSEYSLMRATVWPPARCTLNYITRALPGIYGGTDWWVGEKPDPLPRNPRREGTVRRGVWRMLTGAVNIAVFAAFRMCFDLRSVSNAAFKPVWTMRQLDVSCYGRQKRQETATKWQGELAT